MEHSGAEKCSAVGARVTYPGGCPPPVRLWAACGYRGCARRGHVIVSVGRQVESGARNPRRSVQVILMDRLNHYFFQSAVPD